MSQIQHKFKNAENHEAFKIIQMKSIVSDQLLLKH